MSNSNGGLKAEVQCPLPYGVHMQLPTRDEQLQPGARMTIAGMLQQGHSVQATGRPLQRPLSTISCKLVRNCPADMTYGSHRAELACQACAKLSSSSLSWSLVMTLLGRKWLPQQIAATGKHPYPNEAARHVSQEAIYTAAAQPRGELRRQPIACLCRGCGTRLARILGIDQHGQIPEVVRVHARQPEIEASRSARPLGGRLIKGRRAKSPAWACWWRVSVAWCTATALPWQASPPSSIASPRRCSTPKNRAIR
ncbi:putative transposase for insertion sequence element [Delftia acidovorans]|nr:putative transposase for insertion sequence element [Delftia acidovorans]